MRGWTYVGALVLCAAALAVAGARREERWTSGPMRQQAYVWQRAWTPAVCEAVANHGHGVDGLALLGAEVGWPGGRLSVAKAEIDWSALPRPARAGLALRVGPDARRIERDPALVALLGDLAGALIREANEAGVEVSELQLDYDCPEARLDNYRAWAQAVRRRVAPVPLTITALPCWLDRPEFPRLVSATDGYVLQVHSLELPAGPDAPFTLCDPAAARRAVRKAARFHVPFRVALPTYGYVLAFDSAGKYRGLSAEGPSRAWPGDWQLRTVRADPAEMAALVREWTNRRPAMLGGLIWYRLPTAQDSLNWPAATLAAVMQGRTPQPALRPEIERDGGLVEISLFNDGEAEARAFPRITLRWGGARLVASEGLNGSSLLETDAACALEVRPAFLPPLSPGERRKVAWLRLDPAVEVTAHVQNTK